MLVVLVSGVSELATITCWNAPARSMRARTRTTTSAPTASVAGPQRTGRLLVHGEVARMVGVTPRISATWLGWRGSTWGISRTTAPSAGSGPRLRTRTVTDTTWPTWLTRGEIRSLTARSAPPASEPARTRSGPGSGWGGPGGSGGCGGTGGSGPGSGGSGGTASYWLVTATLWVCPLVTVTRVGSTEARAPSGSGSEIVKS